MAGLLARWNVVAATGTGAFAYYFVVVPDPGDLLSHGYGARLVEVTLLGPALGFLASRGRAWRQAPSTSPPRRGRC